MIVYKSQAYLKQTFMVPISRFKVNKFQVKVTIENSYWLIDMSITKSSEVLLIFQGR